MRLGIAGLDDIAAATLRRDRLEKPSMISRHDPTSVETIASPVAAASRTAIGCASLMLESASTSDEDRYFITSGTRPRNSIADFDAELLDQLPAARRRIRDPRPPARSGSPARSARGP